MERGRDQVGRLRTIILVDVVIALAATVFIVVVHVSVVSSRYLVLLAAMVATSGGLMAAGLRPLRRGDVQRATLWLAVANWSIAISAATIATFAWPLMMLAALLPSVLAASLLSGRQLATYVVTSVAVALGVVLAGLLQDFSGLSDDAPDRLRDVVLIIFAPALVGLVSLVALQNSVSMQGVLASVIASRAALADQADELRRSRARVVAATDRERRRIERDLHDGAQQRLIGIGIALSRAKDLCTTEPVQAAGVLEALRSELRVAHEELRALAQGVYPPVLTEHGLGPALQSAADRCPIPVTVALGGLGRHPADIEAALYFCCVEALQNAVKHASATSIVLHGDLDDATLWISITDDGVGFDTDADAGVGPTGSGIVNITDRLGSIGGGVELSSPPGGGATVRGYVPVPVTRLDCPSSSRPGRPGDP